MNLFIDHAVWFEIVRNLLVITVAIVGLAFIAARLTLSAFWQRTIWQVAFVSIALLSASEVTGLTKGMALWFGGKKPTPQHFVVRTFAPVTSPLPPVEETSSSAIELPVVNSPVAATEDSSILWPGLIWIIGIAVILSRVLFSQALLIGFRLRRQSLQDNDAAQATLRLGARLGLSRPVAVRQSPALRSPIAFGFFRKTIVLPEHFSQTFTPAQREAVLAHELAHLAFNDPAWYLLADFVAAFFWWNPLVWLARRKLHGASENAADEASLLVGLDGATTLAECLVELARQFAPSGAFGWMSIDGNGFRSNLARRVERLLTLQHSEWRLPRPPAVLALKVFAPILLVTLAIVTSAAAQRDLTQPGDLPTAISTAWKDSIGALALNAVTTPAESPAAEPIAPAPRPVAPKVSPVSVTPAAVAPVIQNTPVNNLAPAPIAAERPKTNYTPSTPVSGARILRALQNISLTNFVMDPAPLGEVVTRLEQAIQQHSPADSQITCTFADAALARLPTRGFNLGTIRLLDLLETITDTAPVNYSVNYQGIVFVTNTAWSEKLFTRVFRVEPRTLADGLKSLVPLGLKLPSSDMSATNATVLLNTALGKYFAAAGIPLDPPKYLFYNDRNGQILVRATTRDLETIAAAIEILNVAPPQLTIEAKFAEITGTDAKALGFDWFLGNSIGTANRPAGSTVAVDPKARGFDWFLGNSLVSSNRAVGSAVFAGPNASRVAVGSTQSSNQTPFSVTGIFTDPQYRVAVRALEQRQGVDLLTAPRVTTLSGRQAQISSLDVRTVVTGVNTTRNPDGSPNLNFKTEQMSFGPVLDVIPTVSADGFSVHMALVATVTEFLGYDAPDKKVQKASDAMTAKLTAQVPLPNIRTRQVSTSVNVWDGQTVVLGGLISAADDKSKNKKVPLITSLPMVGKMFREQRMTSQKKNLLIFVTPTIIDPAGNRVHTEADLPFSRNSAPAQSNMKPANLNAFPGGKLQPLMTLVPATE